MTVLCHNRWTRYGVRAVRTFGARGRVRYTVVLDDGCRLFAGPFNGIVEALRHAHRVVVRRHHLLHTRPPRVGRERWLWHAGDLEELVAQSRGGISA